MINSWPTVKNLMVEKAWMPNKNSRRKKIW